MIAERFALPVYECADLRELNFGALEGKYLSTLKGEEKVILTKFFHDPTSVQVPGGESFSDLQTRAIKALYAIMEKQAGKNVAIVAHGGANKAILAHILQMPLAHAWTVQQSNTAYNIFSFDTEYKIFYTDTINNTSHLSGVVGIEG